MQDTAIAQAMMSISSAEDHPKPGRARARSHEGGIQAFLRFDHASIAAPAAIMGRLSHWPMLTV